MKGSIAMPANAAKEPKEPPSVNIRVPKGAGVTVKGFDTLTVGKEATVVLKGSVTNLRHNPNSPYDWENGKGIELTLTACECTGPAAPTSMDDALKSAKRTV